MKIRYVLYITLLAISSCCTKDYCSGFNIEKVHFIPKNINDGEFWSMTPSNSEWSFYRTWITVTKPETISSCDDCNNSCNDTLHYSIRQGNVYNVQRKSEDPYLTYDRNKKPDLLYILNCLRTQSNQITGYFIFCNDTIQFSYTVCDNAVSTSNIMHDSLIIDATTYYDVMELHGKKYSTIYLAKDKGFIQAISADTIWTLNESVTYNDLLYTK